MKDKTLAGRFGYRIHSVFDLSYGMSLSLPFLLNCLKERQNVGRLLWSEDTPHVYFVFVFVLYLYYYYYYYVLSLSLSFLFKCIKERQNVWSEDTPHVYFVLCVAPLTKIGSTHPEFV